MDSHAIFMAMKSEEEGKYIGVRCPVCHRPYCAGEYILVHKMKGTDIALVLLEESNTTCPFCECGGIPKPQFVDTPEEALQFEPVELSDMSRYVGGDELLREDIYPETFHLILKNEKKWETAKENPQ